MEPWLDGVRPVSSDSVPPTRHHKDARRTTGEDVEEVYVSNKLYNYKKTKGFGLLIQVTQCLIDTSVD